MNLLRIQIRLCQGILFILLFIACRSKTDSLFEKEADQFIRGYTESFLRLHSLSLEAQWNAHIAIREADTINDDKSRNAQEILSSFCGKKHIVDSVKYFLGQRKRLSDQQIRQLKMILYLAGPNAEIADTLVRSRIRIETAATSKLYGFTFKIDGKPVTTNEIDELLISATDLNQRQKAWEASKEVGKLLKSDLVSLRDLRNKSVQQLGYKNYFDFQVADYEMSVAEMMDLNNEFVRSVWPLYREIHTYFRYELARKYKVATPEYLPAHWLPNRWGQDWSGLINLKSNSYQSKLQQFSPVQIVKKGEQFYNSLGFSQLPDNFWSKSNLYPYPADSNVKKDNHASAWNMNLLNDVRSLMSVAPNEYWWKTVHHELGHVYYFMEYNNPGVPALLRWGANRAYHEAVGDLIGLASTQLPYLKSQGLMAPDAIEDTMQKMLKEALYYVVHLPWSAGVMTHFEHDLYAGNLDPAAMNAHWWELVKKYQGIVPASPRAETYCDAATKTHIIDDAAQYYDYAISFCLLMQMHEHITRKILKQDPHASNYFGSKETGKFLRSIMRWGQSRNWREVLKESTGDNLNANAMMNYFSPLMIWLQAKNKGRIHSLPVAIQ